MLSGGLDSSTVLAYAISKGYEVHALSFSYGQRHSKEVESSRKVARHFGVPHKVIDIDLRQIGGSSLTSDTPVPSRKMNEISEEIPVTYVPSRNIIFLALAAAYAETIEADEIFIGANAVDYSGYPDCRPEFFNSMEKTLTLGTKLGIEKGIRINVPLQYLTKGEIIRKGTLLDVPYEMTTSCYNGNAKACGQCDSCLLRLKGFQEVGIPDPVEYEQYPDFYTLAEK